MSKVFSVLPFIYEDMEMAATFVGDDYGDDMLLACAIKNRIDTIVTSNIADFTKCKLRVLKPEELK